MKVLLWGCYWQGNFGDDLMAVIFSKYLADKGCDVKVFRLPESLSKRYAVDTCDDVEFGVAWADVVVLGGGAFLQNKFGFFLKLLSPALRDIYSELKKLHVALKLTGKKFVFSSIGSSGATAFEELDPVVRDIMSLPGNGGGTVRLARDVGLLNGLRRGGVKFYPDVLLASYSYIGKEVGVSARNKLRIGVNVSRRDRDFVKALLRWKEINEERVSLDFVLTHSYASGIRSEYGRAVDGVGVVVHEDPCDFMSKLLEYDCIVSVKLHLGLVAMAGGAEFISYRGQKKTLDQLSDLGLSSNVFSRGDIQGVLLALDKVVDASGRRGRGENSKLEVAKAKALAHFETLDELLVF